MRVEINANSELFDFKTMAEVASSEEVLIESPSNHFLTTFYMGINLSERFLA